MAARQAQQNHHKKTEGDKMNKSLMPSLMSIVTGAVAAGTMLFAGATLAQVKEIKIGYLLPLTADNAPQGQQSKRAVDMAVEEINAAGGIKSMGGAKLRIIYADTQSKPQVAVGEAERLISQEKVDFLAGAYNSGVTLPASEVAERYKKVWWVPVSSDDSITNRPGFKYVFRLAEKTSMRIAAQLNFIAEMSKQTNVPVKTVALVFENSGYGQGAALQWRKMVPQQGWTIVLDEPFDPKTTDPSPVITKVKAAKADVVLLANSFMPAAVMMAKSFKEQGVRPKAFFATSAAHTDPDYLKNAGEAALGVFDVSGWEPDVNRPFSKEVAKKFQDKYGLLLNNETAKEYAGMYVVKDVLERAASNDPEKVRNAFAATELKQGLSQIYSSNVRFDSTGTFPDTSSLVLVQFQKINGKVERVTVGPADQARPGQKFIFPYEN
jgi:branched-chain amino acid transport system substrate-binding protein